MTKKHFILLADYIRAANTSTSGRYVPAHDVSFTKLQIQYLADFCQAINSRFDRKRWLDYIAGKCGPTGGAK